jgi:hypothetical protein
MVLILLTAFQYGKAETPILPLSDHVSVVIVRSHRQRRQNRDLVRLDATAGTGESACDGSDARFREPIAFFTALQIICREKGFSRKTDMRSFSAHNATALGS